MTTKSRSSTTLSLNTSQARLQRKEQRNSQQQQPIQQQQQQQRSPIPNDESAASSSSTANQDRITTFCASDEVPVAILLVTNGIRGQHISFAYPVSQQHQPFTFSQNEQMSTSVTEIIPNVINENQSSIIQQLKSASSGEPKTTNTAYSVPTPTRAANILPQNNNNLVSKQDQGATGTMATTTTTMVSTTTTTSSDLNVNSLSSPSASNDATTTTSVSATNREGLTSSTINNNNNNNNGISSPDMTKSGSSSAEATPSTSSTYFNQVFGWHAPALSFILCPPKKNFLNKLMSVTIDDLLFLSRPTAMWTTSECTTAREHAKNEQQASDNTNSSESSSSSNLPATSASRLASKQHRSRRHAYLDQIKQEKNRMMGDFTDFSIVFVFKYGSLPTNILRQYTHLLTLLMKTYEREQKRCMYVANELAMFAKLKDMCKDWESLAKMAYEKITLARELITVVQCIKRGIPLQIRINGWVEIGFKLPSRQQIEHESQLDQKHNEQFLINLQMHKLHRQNNDNESCTYDYLSSSMFDEPNAEEGSSTNIDASESNIKYSSLSSTNCFTPLITLTDRHENHSHSCGQYSSIDSLLCTGTRPKHSDAHHKMSIKPYHACIVAEELPKLVDPPDGLNDVQKVMTFFSPTKNLQDISRDSNMTIELVCSIAQHLVNWGIVRPISQLCSSTILVLSSDQTANSKSCKFPPDPAYVKQFQQVFPNLPGLIDMLEQFSAPHTYHEHLEAVAHIIRRKSLLAERGRSTSLDSIFEMSKTGGGDADSSESGKIGSFDSTNATIPSTLMCNVPISTIDQAVFVQAVFWLLQKNFIKPVQRYIYMMIPQRKIAKPGTTQFSFSPTNSFLLSNSNDMVLHSGIDDQEHVNTTIQKLHVSISQKNASAPAVRLDSADDYTNHSLTSYEVDYLKSICNDRKLLNLFKKICIYFNGQYHEQEIMWLEGISQDEMNYLLQTFSSVLLVIEH